MKKKFVAALLAAAMVFSSAFTGSFVEANAADSYVSVADLSANNTPAPAKDTVIPDANQYEYQKQELAAFCHFGPNTFNEIEWGEHYGTRTPDDIFTLEKNFDAETMVSTLKDAGFKKLIVTAKHHDGFCIWNSEHTTYDVESTSYADYNYDGMGGDVLAEISAACTKYDMDMGLYLSPWDIHEPSYGYKDANGNGTSVDNDVLDYNEFYNNQLIEILSDDKYGNAGHFNEVWMDGAKGSGANAQEYDFQTWFATIQKYEGKGTVDTKGRVAEADCMLFGAQAYTTVRWIGNEHGYAAEETWSKSTVNYENNTIDSRSQDGYTKGYENGNKWTVPESDARITSGWFWGTQKKTPKTVEALAEMYFRSVGHNSPLLLNIPPNNEGYVDQAILDRVEEFGVNVTETFQTNIAKNATVSASEVRGNDTAYSPANVLDKNDNTYWTVNDGTTTGTLLVDLGSTKTFDVVSIEEAIQFGQRIKEFKVEYSNEGGEWKTFDEGTTIGAKRLSRKAPVKADQLRITVKTSSAVPMITEVGVYKASEGFELAGAAPDGMEVIDISDAGFTFASGWTQETGDQYLNGTNAWANAGTNFEVSFTGSKIYLIGTNADPNHGTADIYIDGTKVAAIDTNGNNRAVGQIIYESDTLTDGAHTLKLVTTNKAIGIEGAYVINNGGLGMIGIEEAKYTMNEESQLEVKLVRVGGSTGEATVVFAPNPGSAIQDDYNTERNYTITFADGETEKTAIVETRRNTNPTGDRYFTVELATENNNLILGFNSVARITIKDAEGITTDKLQALVDECEALNAEAYTAESWAAVESALTEAKERLAAGNMSDAVLKNVYEALEAAKAELDAREEYTADDRFQFPNIGETKTLEAEFLEKHNNTEGDNGWPLQVTAKDWASNGKFLNCLNANDEAKLYYNALRTGTYTATVTYRSGDANNSIVWSEVDNKIVAGNVSAGNADANVTKTATFTFEVETAGEGTITFKGGASKAPQIDKIVIEATDLDLFTYNVTKTAGENGTIAGPDTVTEGEDAVFTITADEGYVVQDVKVNGTSVGAVATYTVADVASDITVEATFVKAEFKYTEAEPFVFPSEENASATLEAEYATLYNSGGADETWKLQVSDANWASNGKFVNCLNRNDKIEIPYTATEGTYDVVVTYRSGSNTNYLAWSEVDNKITAGTASAGNDNASVTKTATFELVVTETGAGTLTFAPTTADSPQIDKFEITKRAVPTVCEHTMGEWTVTKAATCTVAGEKTRVCTKDCGHSELETIAALGHAYGEWTVVKAPTTEEAGLEERVCACGEKEQREVAKLPTVPEVVDKTALEEYIEDCVAYYEEADYTAESWAVYAAALADAEAVLANEDATKEDVKEAVEALEAAALALEKVTVEPEQPADPEKPGTDDKEEDKEEDKSPVTGDTAMVLPMVVLMAACAAIVAVLRKRFAK